MTPPIEQIQTYDTLPVNDTVFAYHIPIGEFVYRDRHDNKWNIQEPIDKEGLTHHLMNCGWDIQQITSSLKSKQYISVYGHGYAPWQPAVYESRSKRYLNLWVPPTLRPAAVAGAYPAIDAVLNWVTEGREEDQRWLMHWMAAKVQDPLRLPKVAAVLATRQGGGKNTLAFVMRAILGDDNTDVVGRAELESHFNSRWADKLFLLGDEVHQSENAKEISEYLKQLIDGNEIEREGKFVNQKTIANRIMWMFASNSDTIPVVLEPSDRRYSVFVNHKEIPEMYKQMLYAGFKADRRTPTDAFLVEIQNFWRALLEVEVDLKWISRPLDNEPRRTLINTNKHGHQMFFEHVDEHGIDDLLDEVKSKAGKFSENRETWDFGVSGVEKHMVYEAYRHFCQTRGTLPYRESKFHSSVKYSSSWVESRPEHKASKKRVYCWKTPRKADIAAAPKKKPAPPAKPKLKAVKGVAS